MFRFGMFHMISVLTVGGLTPTAFAHANEVAIVTVKQMTCKSINEALASLPSTGQALIRLKPGIYDCDEPVVLNRSHTSLVGAGRNLTSLQARQMESFPVLVVGDMRIPKEPGLLGFKNMKHDELDALEGHAVNAYSKYQSYDIAFKHQFYPLTTVENVKVSGLSAIGGYYHVDSNGKKHLPKPDELAKDKSGASTDASAKECYDTMSREVSDCNNDGGRKIRNNAITIRRSKNVRIEDVLVAHAFSGGIVLEKDCTDIVVDGFQSTLNAFDGFAGYQTDHSVFKNMLINDNILSGISIDMDFNDNVIQDSKLINNGDNGIFAHHTMGNKYVNVDAIHNGYLYLTNPGKSPGHGAWIDGKRKDIWGKDGKPVLASDGSQAKMLVEHTCDENEFHNVRFIDNAGTPLTFNHLCQRIVLEDLTIKTKDHNKGDCYHNWKGSSVSYQGLFQCD